MTEREVVACSNFIHLLKLLQIFSTWRDLQKSLIGVYGHGAYNIFELVNVQNLGTDILDHMSKLDHGTVRPIYEEHSRSINSEVNYEGFVKSVTDLGSHLKSGTYSPANDPDIIGLLSMSEPTGESH